MSEENTTEITIEQQASVLRRVERLLHEASLLRIARDKEERANRRRKTPSWDESEKLEAKMKELRDYLAPTNPDTGGFWATGLHPKYCSDPSFQCYVLISD